jgi:hypothetical protein
MIFDDADAALQEWLHVKQECHSDSCPHCISAKKAGTYKVPYRKLKLTEKVAIGQSGWYSPDGTRL